MIYLLHSSSTKRTAKLFCDIFSPALNLNFTVFLFKAHCNTGFSIFVLSPAQAQVKGKFPFRGNYAGISSWMASSKAL